MVWYIISKKNTNSWWLPALLLLYVSGFRHVVPFLLPAEIKSWSPKNLWAMKSIIAIISFLAFSDSGVRHEWKDSQSSGYDLPALLWRFVWYNSIRVSFLIWTGHSLSSDSWLGLSIWQSIGFTNNHLFPSLFLHSVDAYPYLLLPELFYPQMSSKD